MLWSALAVAFLPAVVPSQDRPGGSTEPRDAHWLLLPSRAESDRRDGFRRLTEDGSRADVPILRDLLRFAETADEWYRILDAGSAILGRDLRSVTGPWRTLTLEMATDPDWPEHVDYGRWKAELYAERVDPRMRVFFDELGGARIRLHEIVWGGVEVDGIPSLDDPQTESALDADWIEDEEPVFGVSIGGEHRAYPLRILDWHEMANDRLGGVSFALAYCTLCGAGIVYRTDTVDEEGTPIVRRFGSSGLLMRSNKLMFDRATDTLWNQFTGEAVLGPLVGKVGPLEVLPSLVTTWADWRRMHPTTDVVSIDTGVDRPYEPGASYGGYFGSETLMFPAAGRSSGRFAKERVFVLRSAPVVVVPLEGLRRSGVLHVETEDGPVVVLTRDRPVDAPIPERLRRLLEGQGERSPEFASGLELGELLVALETDPGFVRELDAAFLLALPTSVRLPFLREASDLQVGESPSGQPPAPGPVLEVGLRNQVALRGLAGEAFAFRCPLEVRREFDDRGVATFVSADGGRFAIEEDAFVGIVDGREVRFARLPGHLAFGFGVEAFLPDAEWRDAEEPDGSGR